MIFHQCEQGGDEWHMMRLGIPTSSEFSRIVTKTLKLSASADKYIGELAAADYLQMPLDKVKSSPWMDRGKIMEPAARSYLEFVEGITVVPGGFATSDDGLVGASADGLIGDDGVVEIKTKEAGEHVTALLDPCPDDHKPQIQGQLMVYERQYCLRLYFNPDLPSLVVRVERDEEYIERLRAALYECDDKGNPSFLQRLDAAKAKLLELGGKRPPPSMTCRCWTADRAMCGSRDRVEIDQDIPRCFACREAMTAIEQEIFG